MDRPLNTLLPQFEELVEPEYIAAYNANIGEYLVYG
jgi:hypothetical protein